MAVELSRKSAPTGGPEPGSVRSLRIEPAEGGYIVSCDRVPPRSKDGGMAYDPYGSKQVVVKTVDELHNWIDDELGESGDDEAGEGDDTDEGAEDEA